MRKTALAAMTLVLLLGACGGLRDSRFNPINWFGGARDGRAVEDAGPVGDGRELVAQVIQFSVEPAVGGAVLRATGLPPTQGWYEGELVLVPDEDKPDELLFRFVIRAPVIPNRVSTQQSREVTVARFVSDYRLEGIRRITVTAEGNARTVSRR
jgi:hypothetical protein